MGVRETDVNATKVLKTVLPPKRVSISLQSVLFHFISFGDTKQSP